MKFHCDTDSKLQMRMKTNQSRFAMGALTRWVLALGCLAVGHAFADPGTIRAVTDVKGVARVGEEITVVILIQDYTDPVEVDGFNLVANYDPSLLEFVPDSLSFGDASGEAQQWLSKPNQETVGYHPVAITSLATPGKLHLSLADLGYNSQESGTVARSGVLASFKLRVIGEGTSALTLEPLGGAVLFDSTLSPAGKPALVGEKRIKTKRSK